VVFEPFGITALEIGIGENKVQQAEKLGKLYLTPTVIIYVVHIIFVSFC